MKINYDCPIDLILNHQLEDGLYHWSDRESEDSGWNNFDHFSFFENKEIIWSIDYCRNISLYFIRINGKLKPVSVDGFLDFISLNVSKETFNWLMFETDFFIKKEN